MSYCAQRTAAAIFMVFITLHSHYAIIYFPFAAFRVLPSISLSFLLFIFIITLDMLPIFVGFSAMPPCAFYDYFDICAFRQPLSPLMMFSIDVTDY